MMFRMEYECPCGTTWTMTHDCTCNDRCPSCNKENEPVNVLQFDLCRLIILLGLLSEQIEQRG